MFKRSAPFFRSLPFTSVLKTTATKYKAMKKMLSLISLVFLTSALTAQLSVCGKVSDAETGEGMIGANVQVTKQGVWIQGTSTDFDGNYCVELDPGTYDFTFSYVGLKTVKLERIVVKRKPQKSILNISMSGDEGIELCSVVVTGYKVPLIEQDHTSSGSTIRSNQLQSISSSQSPTTSGSTLSSEEIRNLPTRNISALAAQSAGMISVVDETNNVTVRSSRSDATDYYLDGIRVSGNADLIPQSEINQLQTLFGGLNGGTPAAFGNYQEYLNSDIWTIQEPQAVYVPKIEPPVQHFSQEDYQPYIENEFKSPREEDYSTFSIDVDYASYSNMRRYINSDQTPPRHSVRIEEMVNYFSYDYPQPTDEHPFSITTELSDCPWNESHQLLHVGMKGKDIDFSKAAPNNLVFLIDVSGSMQTQFKLELLKPAFELLVKQLRPEDRVAIVTYAGHAGVVLPSTSGSQQDKILDAINNLTAGGSTAGSAGIETAYDIAQKYYIENGNNRIILATDGDFNVGISNRTGLFKLIQEKREAGIYLTALGFGYGNLKDNTLELLADNGNGQYAYIDNLKEAKKVFINEMTGTLYTIAKDVKIQLFFNKKIVNGYRLIGYENRLLSKEDFEDDTKDAGELGAGHTVTAIYELDLSKTDTRTRMVDVRLRYKLPKENQSRFFKKVVNNQRIAVQETSNNFRFSAAVASFGLLLIDSKFKGEADTELVLDLAKKSMGEDKNGYREEFIDLVENYETMTLTSSN